MKKKIMAFLLLVVMMISLAACGKSKEPGKKQSEADITALFDKADGMEARTVELTMDIDVTGKESATNENNAIKLGIKVSAYIEADQKEQATIYYKLENAEEYKTLTTAVFDGSALYVDFVSLKAAALDICNTLKQTQVAAMLSVLPEAEYIKIDQSVLEKYVEADTLKDAKTGEKVVRTIVEYVLKTVQDATKEVTPVLITGSDSELKFSLTKENLVPVSDALLRLDLAAKYDDMVEKVRQIGNTDQYVTELTNSKEETVSGLKDILNEVKNEKDDFDVFDLNGTVGVSGETGKRKLTEKISATIEQKSEKVKVTMNMTCKEEAAENGTVTIPSNATDFSDYMTQLSQLLKF